MQDGWIKLFRSIQDKSYYRNSKILHLWIHLLLEATHKEMEVSFGGKPVTLKPGQILTGRDELARKTGIHQASIERVLNRLQIEQQIEQQTSTKNRIISIVNWEKYQKPEQQIERKPNNNRTTSEHIQEVKEVKEVIIPPIVPPNGGGAFDRFWKAYPIKSGKDAVKKAWDRKNLNSIIETILSSLEEQKKSQKWVAGYIPYPLTWINQGRWQDEPPEAVGGDDKFKFDDSFNIDEILAKGDNK